MRVVHALKLELLAELGFEHVAAGDAVDALERGFQFSRFVLDVHAVVILNKCCLSMIIIFFSYILQLIHDGLLHFLLQILFDFGGSLLNILVQVVTHVTIFVHQVVYFVS